MPRTKRGNSRAGNGSDGDPSSSYLPSGPQPVTFTEDQLTYSPEEFLCPGQDDHGASVRLTFRCPPQMERALEILRDHKAFPYKTVSDIVRHAVHRHLAYCYLIEDGMPRHILSALDAVLEVCRDAGFRAAMEQTYQEMDHIIERHLEAGDTGEALRLMTLAKAKITPLPDSRWKRIWLEKFSRKYSHHLTAAANAASQVENDTGVVMMPDRRG